MVCRLLKTAFVIFLRIVKSICRNSASSINTPAVLSGGGSLDLLPPALPLPAVGRVYAALMR
ncbi:hypothetical protein SAMN02910435_01493 [Ruminococcaceae bacterium D5]|nr:hypothetical protein SAMN02910435_01493 [Ruminococcaceae bacterium D5]